MPEIKSCENCINEYKFRREKVCLECDFLHAKKNWQPKPDEMITVETTILEQDNMTGELCHKEIMIEVSTAQLHSLGYYKLNEVEIDIDYLTRVFCKWDNSIPTKILSGDRKEIVDVIVKANPIKPKNR